MTNLLQGTTREEYASQGKSNNYISAHRAGQMTAGEAAKALSKRLGCKVTAKQIEPLAGEYHHAGRFGGNKARRVFFFSPEELDAITLDDVTAVSKPVWGWVLGFRKEGRGRYVPIVAGAGRYPANQAHRLGDKFHELSEAEAMEAIEAVGKTLPPFRGDWREAT